MQRAKRLYAALFCLVPLTCGATKPDATIVVTTGADVSGDPGQCSLREAFDNVNAGGKVGTNNCAAAVLTSDSEFTEILLEGITAKLEGNEIFHSFNHARIKGGVIDADYLSRIFHVSLDGTFLILDDTELRNGVSSGSGGAILVESGASLFINHTLFAENVAISNGGAISMDGGGVLDVVYSGFYENSARLGGAIWSGGAEDADIVNSRFWKNIAGYAGGAIYNDKNSIMALLDSRLEENEVEVDLRTDFEGYGGAIYTAKDLWMRRVAVLNNAVQYGDGGGICIESGAPNVSIEDSLIDRNKAGSMALPGDAGNDGGGIYADGGFRMEGTTVSNNEARENGAGIAISNAAATSTIQILNSSIMLNDFAGSAGKGGGIWITGTPTPFELSDLNPLGADYGLQILNTTISQNLGQSQLHIEGGQPSAGTILFVNNVINAFEGNTAPCSGDVTRLATKRANDASADIFNIQWLGGACGAGMKPAADAVGAYSTGWYYDMPYALTKAKDPGDSVVCKAVGSRDQFGNPRQCRLGAVEFKPPSVPKPLVYAQ
jgi:predicted outer membrane repeat protein